MMPVYTIHVSSHQNAVPVEAARLRRAVRAVLEGASIARAEVSVAVVDDATIHDLNRRHLDHDCATDVLSFVLESDAEHLEGEIVASAETAVSGAAHYGWPAADELLLYVIHGALHLVGLRDGTAAERAAMRQREREHLGRFGLDPPWATAAPAAPRPPCGVKSPARNRRRSAS